MSLRPVKALELAHLTPGPVDPARPQFCEVDPRVLLVDETYQRGMGERSRNLIRRIVAGWSWHKFKPPVCMQVGDALHVIDGQHTATAAASHPDIAVIPVMIVAEGTAVSRALSFVAHNRDRVAVTPMQVHAALAAAGDEDALTLDQVCARAGARVLRAAPGNGAYKPGDVMALKGLRDLIGRRHAAGARRVIEICVKARCAPVGKMQMRAVEELLFGPDYAGAVDAAALAAVMLAAEADCLAEAQSLARSHGIARHKALAEIWFHALQREAAGQAAGSAAGTTAGKAADSATGKTAGSAKGKAA